MTTRNRFAQAQWSLILQRVSDVFRSTRVNHGNAVLALADTIGDLLVVIEENRSLATLSDAQKRVLVLELLQAAQVSEEAVAHAGDLFDILYWTASRCAAARRRRRRWRPACLGGHERIESESGSERNCHS